MAISYRRIVDGEPSYGQGQQNFLQGIDAVAQAIGTRLKLFTGEWWEDINDGLPVWTNLLGYTSPNTNKLNVVIISRILGTQLNNVNLVTDVKNISNTYDPKTRAYTFTGIAISIYGPITVTNSTGS